jgi:hypothetical protein
MNYITNFVLHAGPYKSKGQEVFRIQFNSKSKHHVCEFKVDERGITNVTLAAALRVVSDIMSEDF